MEVPALQKLSCSSPPKEDSDWVLILVSLKLQAVMQLEQKPPLLPSLDVRSNQPNSRECRRLLDAHSTLLSPRQLFLAFAEKDRRPSDRTNQRLKLFPVPRTSSADTLMCVFKCKRQACFKHCFYLPCFLSLLMLFCQGALRFGFRGGINELFGICDDCTFQRD